MEPEWQRFTPREVDVTRCMARTWGEGVGGQCNARPVQSCEGLCKRHSGQQTGPGWHGRVDGPIPEAKLREFRKASARKAARALPASDDPAGVGLAEGPAAEPPVPAAEAAACGGGQDAGVSEVGRAGRRRTGAMAVAAAEARAMQEDESERRQRLDIAAGNRVDELRGRLMGRLRVLQMDIPLNINRMTELELQRRYDQLLPQALRGADV